ncbi:leucine-rich PPR motif-containing protein, mitochondrial [Polypterus senegalus]|uniref:leucine-rich PPR motif-containing protein, mitochondrial n=1 Tax=Polypterus senegalus TaxID=55291 RepID=UPI001965D2AC|nr:leucine-rich PPR motif-containing protein, mitochondrial [Polypterus senegalus]
MAALLRSARILIRSSAVLLRVPQAGARACHHPKVASFEKRYLTNVGTRLFSIATQQTGLSKEESSTAVRSRQAQQFDWALNKLDSSVRRTGRITKTLLLKIFHDICRTGYPSGNQALLLLRSCGSLLPEIPLAERTELAHRIWDKLQSLGAVYDVSHYNALLKVYLQNEHKFLPTEFLSKMEAASIVPNRVTYQRLISAYCNEGDIEGASKILGFMKSNNLPITEAVFSALVTGHSRASDMENAENILSVMKTAGIEPGPDTYLALLKAYAEKGDIEHIKQTLETIEKTNVSLIDRDLLQVIFSLSKSGHEKLVPDILERMRHDRGYIPDAMNLCLTLVTRGLEDTAFEVLKMFPLNHSEGQNGDATVLGNFFLRHCVNMDKSIDRLKMYCRKLQESGLHTSALQFTLYCALDAKKTGMAVELMKEMKMDGLPVRQHYFWPLLIHHQKHQNVQGTSEVLRAMQELGLETDVDTYSNYVLSSFDSLDSARAVLKESGCSLDSPEFAAAELRIEASRGNLENVLSLLSSPVMPAVELGIFRGGLISGFRRSKDVSTMSKITELLYRDGRYCQAPSRPTDLVGFFLYNLIDSMSDSEVQAKEEVLRQYFHQLKEMDIVIPANTYRGIRNLLDSYHVPELIKDVLVLVDQESLKSSDLQKSPDSKVSELESKLRDLKAEGRPVRDVLKQLILALCAEENLQKALEVKETYEADMAVGGYAALINQCCRHGKAEEALSLKQELNRKDSSATLDINKYLSLVKVFSKDGRLQDAVDILKEIKEKNVELRDSSSSSFFHILNASAMRGEEEAVKRLQDEIFTLDLAKPSANLCSPLVTVYLERGDLSGALDATIDCQKKYNQLPRLHDILCKLVENGETELLQKAMDYISQERGEMTMLYDIFFAFLQTKKYKEARRIIETPGLRARSGRLQWFAEKCITANQVDTLEQLVEMTQKLFESDRDEMYYYLLRSYQENGDWKKAEIAWTKMQEENIIPRDRTLRLLAEILESGGQEVPFSIPETWYEEANVSDDVVSTTKEDKLRSPQIAVSAESHLDFQRRVISLCKRKKTADAYTVLLEAEDKGITLSSAAYNILLKSLLAESNLENATKVKDIACTRIKGFTLSDAANSLLLITQGRRGHLKDAVNTLKSILQAERVPTQMAITRLVQGLGKAGDVEGIQEVEGLMEKLAQHVKVSRMLYINNTALAHIYNQNTDQAVEYLESLFTPAGDGTKSLLPLSSISFVFRRVLEEKLDSTLDKLSVMAERLAQHFSFYRPVTDLFLQLLDVGRVDDARLLLQRCAGIAEQRDVLVSYITKVARNTGKAEKITTLLDVVPDFMDREVAYAYLMKCYSLNNDCSSAKELYEKMLKENVKVDELCLKRLAVLLRNAGEPLPFTEPPESFKYYADKLRQEHQEPSSSSSSEED